MSEHLKIPEELLPPEFGSPEERRQAASLLSEEVRLEPFSATHERPPIPD